MVDKIGVQNYTNMKALSALTFGSKDAEKRSKCENHDRLMAEDIKKHPISTRLKIQSDKLTKAFTKYPVKGFKGSKNANFYEFLTMGSVPYLTGSAMLIAVFNGARAFISDEAKKQAAAKLGNKMGLGVLFYGIAKVLSKKLIEIPVKWKHGIDVNLPYIKKIDELPEEDNKNNLVSYEYHKAYESVDFPRWDLFYNNKFYGEDRNSYFSKIADKMNINDGDLEHADQKVKPKIKEKVIQTKVFSTLISYLWAAVGVGVAMQKPWEKLSFNLKEIGSKFVKSCKEFVNNPNPAARTAGRVLLGAAVGMTLLGNFITLFDFNKDKGSKTQAASSLIDESKEKVVC